MNPPKSRNWFITLNNPTYALEDDMERFFKAGILKAYAGQLEIGPKSGTLHYHFNMIFKHPVSWKRCQALVPGCEHEITQDEQAVWNYTEKVKSRVYGPWSRGDGPDTYKPGKRSDLEVIRNKILSGRPMDEIKDEHFGSFARYESYFKQYKFECMLARLKKPDIKLYDWQEKVLELLRDEPVKRRIIWIWSEESSVGKSTFYDYIAALTKGKTILGCYRLSDTLMAYDDHKVIWFDVPRQQPLDAEFTAQLETLSNGGLLTSSKFKVIQKIVEAHIVVTCNRPPIHDKLPNRIIDFCVDIKKP